mmetsp:Transcript_16795/g.37679  ORF Transcript_16795/g.37679 Transcript_16795/m.37679 type:complete len:156 (-) Transcript_16795:711-1178(-)
MNGDGGRSSTPSGGGVRNPYARTNNRAQPRPTSSITARHFGQHFSRCTAASCGAAWCQQCPRHAGELCSGHKYINQCLVAKQYPPFEELTEEHVTGNHLVGFVHNLELAGSVYDRVESHSRRRRVNSWQNNENETLKEYQGGLPERIPNPQAMEV